MRLWNFKHVFRLSRRGPKCASFGPVPATPTARCPFADPARRGWRYWAYNINHMGMNDIAAQLDHIHNVKCAELGAGG